MNVHKIENRRHRHMLKEIARYLDNDVLLNLHDLDQSTQARTALGSSNVGRYRKMGRGNQEAWQEF